MKTKIEWTDRSWNPVTGCTPVSDGCAHCYARRMATRLRGRGGYDQVNPFRPTQRPERLGGPFRWRQPSRVFVCSMGDLFHEDIPDSFIEAVLFPAHTLTNHTWLILTKRPARMSDFFRTRPIPPTAWLGTTIENQDAANHRLPCLTAIQCDRLWISAEPLLESINITESLGLSFDCIPVSSPLIRWVVCGAETGPGHRVFNDCWARHLKDQCVAAGVPFFFKASMVNGKKISMPELDGQRWQQDPNPGCGSEVVT